MRELETSSFCLGNTLVAKSFIGFRKVQRFFAFCLLSLFCHPRKVGVVGALCGTLAVLTGSVCPACAQVLFGTTIGTGLNDPLGLVVDSAGNVYIGDNGNNRIVRVTPAGVQTTSSTIYANLNSFGADNRGDLFFSGYDLPSGATNPVLISCPTTVTSANCPLNDTQKWGIAGVTLDSAGNLYMLYEGTPESTTAAAAVLKVPAIDSNCSTLSDCKFIGVGAIVTAADGLYVDTSGYIYVAGLDASNNSIVSKISPAGVAATLPITGLNFSTNDIVGMTVDASGNFYISDWLNNRVEELTPSGVQSTVPTISTLLGPAGLAFDSAGNLYIADSGNNRVLISRPGTSGTLNFGSVNVNSISSAQAITASFVLDTTLSVSSILVLTDGASGRDFKNSGTGTCSASTYQAGSSCTVSVVFSPTAPGARKGALVLQDSSGNLLGTEYTKHPEVWREASPAFHISKEVSPFLIVHGAQDRGVPISQAQELLENFSPSGVSVSFIKVNDAHTFQTLDARRELAMETVAFFSRYLGNVSPNPKWNSQGR